MADNVTEMWRAVTALESDPEFAKMTHAKQQEVRAEVIASYLNADPQYAALGNARKLQVLQDVADRPPVYENPKLGAQFGAMAKAYNDEAVAVKEWETRNQTTVAAAYSTPGKRPEEPAPQGQAGFAVKNFIARSSAISKMNLGNTVVRGMEKVGLIPDNTSEMLYGNDVRKATEYFRGLVDRNEGRSGGANALAVGGAALGGALNLAAYAAGTKLGPTRFIKAEVIPALTEKVIRSRLAPFNNLYFVKGITQAMKMGEPVVEAIGAGLVGVVDDTLGAMNEGRQQSVGNVLRAFGSYAAADFVFGQATKGALHAFGVSLAKVTGRSLTRSGEQFGSLLSKYSTTEQEAYEAALAATKAGRDIDPAALGRMPIALQDRVLQIGQISDYMTKSKFEVGQVNQLTHAQLAANSIQMTVRPLGPEGYRIIDQLDTGFEEIHPTLKGVKLRIQDKLMERVKEWSKLTGKTEDEVFSQMRNNVWWTTPFTDAPQNIGRLFGRKALTESPNFESEPMLEAMQKKSYVPIRRRSVINDNELSALQPHLRSNTEYFQEGYVVLSPKQAQNTERLLRPFSNLDTVEFHTGNVANAKVAQGFKTQRAMAVAHKVAAPNEWLATVERARRMKAAVPEISDTVEQLAEVLEMQKGFDAVQSGKGVRLLYPAAQLKMVDNRIGSASGKFEKVKAMVENAAYSNTDLTAFLRVQVGIASEGGKVAGKVAGEAVSVPITIGDDKLLATVLGDLAGPNADQQSVSNFVKLYLRNFEGFENARIQIKVDPQLNYGTKIEVGRTLRDNPMIAKQKVYNLLEVGGLKFKSPLVTVAVPQTLASPAVRKGFVHDLVADLNALKKVGPVELSAKGGLANPSRVARSYARSVQRYAVPQGFGELEQQKWVDDILSIRGGVLDKTAEGYVVDMGGVGPTTFKTWQEAFDHVMDSSVTEKQMQVALSEQGYTLRRMVTETGAQWRVVGPAGKYVPGWNAVTMADLVQKTGIRPKLDASIAPKLLVIGDDPNHLVYDSGMLTGSIDKLKGFMDNFSDWQKREFARVFSIGGNVELTQYSPVRIEAYVPGLGARQTFQDTASALKWADEIKTAQGTWKECARRGFDMTMVADGYRIRGMGVDGTFKALEGEDGVAGFLAKHPDPEYVPNMLPNDVEDMLVETLDYVKVPSESVYEWPKMFAPPKVINRVPRPGIEKINQFIMPRREFLYRAFQRTGNDDMMALWRDLDKGVTLWKYAARRDETLLEQMFEPLYDVPKGTKAMSVEDRMWRRMMVGQFLELDDEAGAQFLKTHKLWQDGQFIKVATDARDYYDRMFAKFGIDGRMWRSNYLPHIRQYFAATSEAQINKVSTMLTDDALENVFGKGKVPKEVKFWAEHQRFSDFATDLMDKDPLSQMLRYNTQGLKKLYLGESYKRIAAIANQKVNTRGLSDGVLRNLRLYIDQINGVDVSDAEFIINDFEQKFAKVQAKQEAKLHKKYAVDLAQYIKANPDEALKLKSGELPENMQKMFDREAAVSAQLTAQKFRAAQKGWLSTLFSLNYSASMGWRPWVTIRNMFQVYTTGSMQVGTGYITRSMKELAEGDVLDHVVDRLRKNGQILETAPIIGDILEENTKLGGRMKGAIEHGLRGLKGSDEWSRAVVWHGHEIKLNEAIELYKRGKLLNLEDTFAYADIDMMPTDVYQRAMGFAQKAKWDQVMDLTGTEAVEASMFVYRSSANPIWKRGIVGKLAGQYTVYPFSYLASITNTLSKGYAPMWKRVAAVTRLATNSAAIYGALRLMGVNAKDFLPWNPIQASFGPNFWFMTNAMSVLDDSYRGRQSRAEFDRLLPFNATTVAGQLLEGREVKPKFAVPGSFVPGWYQLMAAKDAIKLWNDGRSWDALLRLMSFPIANDENNR